MPLEHPEEQTQWPEGELTANLLRLVETLGDGIILLDREWKVRYVNQEGRRISRLEDRHLNGPSHWELYPETVGQELESIYRRSMSERVSLEHEFYYSPFDIWLWVKTIPVSLGMAVWYRDVTRLKKAETMRDRNARMIKQIFETITDGVIFLDQEYRFTFLNRRAEEMLAPRGDVMGKSLWAAFPSAVYEGSPYVSIYGRAMEQRIPGQFEAYYPEPLNSWFGIEARPVEEGGIAIFFRDITAERNAAEDLRRKSEEAERQAAEIEVVYRTAPIGLALFDTEEFRYLRLNDRQAAFFGLKPEQVLGRTLTEMAPIPGLRELFEQVREGTPVVNYPLEGELISHPGEHRYWTVNYSPVRNADGTVRAISAASLEITQQKKAEKALIQSEKLAAVGRLASSISHEINNPLESVTNLLYLIATHPDLSPEVRAYVDLTQAEIARVSQIATQTLRFHRQAVSRTMVSAEQLVRPVLNLYQGRLMNCNVHLEAEFPDATRVNCLENEIRQVVSNLIGNAIDAMRTGGRLRIRSHRATDLRNGRKGVRITVSDDGHGMSRETLARIFEPFFTTKDLNGTGLGLWISQEIVQRHQGLLMVRSSQDERFHGTVFSLFLPVGVEASAAES